MSKNSKIALGIIGAMAAGVVIGLLVAPEKGKDLRKSLKKNASKWSDQLSHLFSHSDKEDMTNVAKEKVSRAKEAVV
jgi:gas vesicle protein